MIQVIQLLSIAVLAMTLALVVCRLASCDKRIQKLLAAGLEIAIGCLIVTGIVAAVSGQVVTR